MAVFSRALRLSPGPSTRVVLDPTLLQHLRYKSCSAAATTPLMGQVAPCCSGRMRPALPNYREKENGLGPPSCPPGPQTQRPPPKGQTIGGREAIVPLPGVPSRWKAPNAEYPPQASVLTAPRPAPHRPRPLPRGHAVAPWMPVGVSQKTVAQTVSAAGRSASSLPPLSTTDNLLLKCSPPCVPVNYLCTAWHTRTPGSNVLGLVAWVEFAGGKNLTFPAF